MKRQQYLVGFASIILLFSAFQIQAQLPVSTQNTEKDKQDEIEVKAFADSFLESFIEVKDIDKVSSDFFEEDFKTRFAEENCLLEVLPKKENPLPEKYKTAVAFHNFFNLLVITTGINFDKEKYSETENDLFLTKSLPPNILENIKKSKWLSFVLDGDDEEKEFPEPKTLEEFNGFTAETLTISNDLKKYLQNHPPNKSQNFLKAKDNFFKYYPAKPCEGESCMGLPEKTPVFAVHKLMFCLRIAKIDGEWKIVQISSVACED